MNRANFRQLAEDRVLDATALLAQSRWSGAHYLIGYAVECGLKACIMKYVAESGVIFQDKKFSEKCWIHGLDTLVDLANLRAEMTLASTGSPAFSGNWGTVKDWKESSRYDQKSEVQARELYDAVTIDPEGVMQWIRIHWIRIHW